MDNFNKHIINNLIRLDQSKQVLFAYLCCKRMDSNYRYFSQKENWGNPEVLEMCLNAIEEYILNEKVEFSNIQNLKEKLHAVTPDTENFSSLEASYALNGAAAIYSVLEFITSNNIEDLAVPAVLVRDTVDFYIQEKENMEYTKDADFERKISEHPLMVKEIQKQNSDIDYLAKNEDALTRNFIVELLKSNHNNIDL